MITENIDLTKLKFNIHINGLRATGLNMPMGFRENCSDLFPMGKGTFILEDGSRVHGSKIKPIMHSSVEAGLRLLLKD